MVTTDRQKPQVRPSRKHFAIARLLFRRQPLSICTVLQGSRLRRRLTLAEFVVGAAGGAALGLLVAFRGTSAGWRLIGAWIVGIGINYVALAFHAASLSRRGVLDAELAGVDVWRELRRYSYLQFWIGVPLLMAVLSVRHGRRR
jgi:hypothetical protein